MPPRVWKWAACLLPVTLVGCDSGEHGDLHTWITQQRAEIKPRITPLHEPKLFMPQAYLPGQSLEPFNKAKLIQVLNRDTSHNASDMALLVAEQNRRKEDLENYPLDTMAMVGSMRQRGQEVALVRVNQLIYQVGIGNHLGQNYGRVVRISDNSLQLREIIQDPSGDWVEKMTTLDLQEGGK